MADIIKFPPTSHAATCDCNDVWVKTDIVVADGKITAINPNGKCSSCGKDRFLELNKE